MATSTFLSLEQFTFIAVPPDSQISSLRVSIYADGRLILNGKLAEVLSGKAVEIRFTDDARHLCFFESDSENAVRFPKNGSKRFPSAVEHLKKHKISLPARYEVKFSEDLAFWQGGLQRKPSCNQVKEPSKFEAEIEALPYAIRTFVRSLLSDETNEDAFHDIVLCCYEAMDETGHFSRAKTLSRIKDLTQKQRREQNTLYKRNNISFNQCVGDSKTPVSEWLNVSGWREWE